MLFNIRGKLWRYRLDDLAGHYGYADYNCSEVVLREGQDHKELLDTLLHETLHVLNPDLSEEAVVEMTRVLMEVTWAFWVPGLVEELEQRKRSEEPTEQRNCKHSRRG